MSANELWKQSGKFFLWSYRENTRNYPGWHFTCDMPGCSSLTELLALFQSKPHRLTAAISLTAPDAQILAIPNNRGAAAKWVAAKTLKLQCREESVDGNGFRIIESADECVIVLGKQRIPEMLKAVGDIGHGRGDYSIRSDDDDDGDRLWIWWMPPRDPRRQ